MKGFGDGKNTAIGWIDQLFIDVDNLHIAPVSYESVHANADHPEPFLNGFLEISADSHDFTHRFHAGTQILGYPDKFSEVPARDFHHTIVEGRFKTGSGLLGDRIFQFVQSVTQSEFGRNECQWIARSLGGQRRGPRQSGIYLDYPVIF